MKKLLPTLLLLLMTALTATAAKTVYIPDSWAYNSSTQEYTEGGNSDLQWSYSRSKQSDNCIIFWQKGFGSDPSKAPSLNGEDMTFDVDDVLRVAEDCYALNMNTLGFDTGNMKNKYKLMILMNYTTTWTCYGGGYDFEVSALWLNPATVKPAGHSLAHEVGHSFHYMCYAEAANYNHNSSTTINTGFHLGCGNGQSIWEQTAQWQANQAYPEEMFNQSYPLFGNNVNYAFSHEWMRYQSYWFHYYLSQYYNDITTVAKVWRQPMTGQTDGDATDFCQALMALKGMSATAFYECYFDYALHCATYDFDAAASYRDNYIGKFDYHAVKLSDNKYQVAYASAPQSTGFNVIELNAPAAGTTVSTRLTALTPGCALAEGDPGEYNNGEGNKLVSAGTTTYNSMSSTQAAYRGFRAGYVFLKTDGTRTYVNDNAVHCTGTGEKTETISATVPSGVSRMFLVVAPALTTYVKHKWDENILNDDQWPYKFELENTTAKNVTPYISEPEFTKQIDGREIADVTLTYQVVLPPAEDYTGASVTFANSGLNALCTAFQMEADDIFNNILAYAATQANGTIMNYAATSDLGLQTTGNTANGDFGHWFQADGTVTNWGNNSVVFAEFSKANKSAQVGQYPGANANGTTRTIREALVYKDNNGNTATAYLVFNISFVDGATPYSYLSDIDYTGPGSEAEPVEYTYDWTLTEEEMSKTAVELRRSGNYDTQMNQLFQQALGLTTSELQTKLSETLTYNLQNNGTATVGLAGGNVPSGYVAYYPLDTDGNIVTTRSTTFNDYGWWFNANGEPSAADGTNQLAMCLDWIAHEWVLQQNGHPAYNTTYKFGVAVVYNNGTRKTAKIWFNITTPMQSVTLKDSDTAYEQQQTECNVTLQRSLPAGKWLSFCAPFNIYSDEWDEMDIEKVQKLTGVTVNKNEVTLNFSDEQAAMMVGIPYLIRMKESREGITKPATLYGPYTDQPVTTVTDPTGSVTARMIGTYVKIDLDNDVYYIQDDKFRHTVYTSDQKTAMKGWRAYFTISDAQSGVKTLNFSLDGEDTPTAIEETAVVVDEAVSVYDLSGRCLKRNVNSRSATVNLAPGVYIINGKKALVR